MRPSLVLVSLSALVPRVVCAQQAPAPRRVSVDVSGTLGGLVAAVRRERADAPYASPLLAGTRIEVGYEEAPSWGLTVGGTIDVLYVPTTALALAPSGRFTFPRNARVPVRGAVSVAAGAIQSFTGAQGFRPWFTADVRLVWCVSPRVVPFVAVGVEGVPTEWSAVWGGVGLQVAFGDEIDHVR